MIIISQDGKKIINFDNIQEWDCDSILIMNEDIIEEIKEV